MTDARKAAFEYQDAVNNGVYPSDSYVPLEPPFRNEAGRIQNLLLRPCQSVAVLESRGGSVRANHYHKTDWHYTYVLSGRVYYFEREIGSEVIPNPTRYIAGQMFFTPPMKEHAMLFADYSIIVTMAKNERSHESHESDVVRVTFVTPEVAKQWITRFA